MVNFISTPPVRESNHNYYTGEITMGKIILAREADKGMRTRQITMLITMSLVCGFGGLPVGAILSGVMQAVLQDSSIPVMYGFLLAPIFAGMIIGFFVMKKDMDLKNHTRCESCGETMQPLTELDTVFQIPARGEETYENAMQYLAASMERVSGVHDIAFGQRGCFACVYRCRNCGKHLLRIMDFLPDIGNCIEKHTYYFDYHSFCRLRGKNDLT